MKAYIIYLVFISVQWWFIKHLSINAITVEEKKHKYFLIIACAELIILAGIRGYSVGADTSVYLSAFEYYKALPKTEILTAKLVYPYDFESGYFFLTKLCVLLGLSKTAFLFLIAALIYIPIFTAIYKRSTDPYISILTYFAFGLFSYSLGIFRQMIALSIVMCGTQYIKDRKFFQYLLLIIIAMMFHSTAVLALVIYFLYPLNWNINTAIFISISAISLVFGNYIVKFMIIMMPKYSGYTSGTLKQGGSYLMLILFLMIFTVQYLLSRLKPPTEYDKIMFDALGMTLLIQSLGYSLNIFGRSIGYFSVYLIFLIPNLIGRFMGKCRSVIRFGAIVFLFALILYNLSASLSYIEYVTFWS